MGDNSKSEETVKKDNKDIVTQTKNFSYMYLPFCIQEKDGFSKMNERIAASGIWKACDDDLKYLFRFVTNKVNGLDGEKRCVHYVIKKENDGLVGKTLEYKKTSKKTIAEDRRGKYAFTVDDIELYLFSTSIGIFIFKVTIDCVDEDYIINARYNMKMVSNRMYTVEGGDDSEFTLLSKAQERINAVSGGIEAKFFYYLNSEGSTFETAFILTYLYAPEPGDHSRVIQYMRKGLGTDFNLNPCDVRNNREGFSISENVNWGITDQSAVCVGEHREGQSFVETELPRNIRSNYKYMFAFLLHQKYVLYHFLMQIDTELQSSPEMLQDYRRRLNEFKRYFVFSRISETEQYQALYERVQEAFQIGKMQEDVSEPLSLITEYADKEEKRRAEEEDEKSEERDNNLNMILALMSLLAVFSAWTDANQFGDYIISLFVGKKSEEFPHNGFWENLSEHWLSFGFFLIVLIISGVTIFKAVPLIVGYFRSKRRKKK